MLWTLQCSNSAVILSCCRSRTRHLLHHQQSWSSASKGMKTLGHRHNGHEQFLILEGELHESDGTILRAGDLVFYRDGTEHNSYTPNGCLLAVHIAGPEFPVD
jgi:anti-sigma factor ChrR (cupin superfamily)